MVSVYKKTNIANFGWKALRTPPLGEGHQASRQLSDASTPLMYGHTLSNDIWQGNTSEQYIEQK